MKPFTAKFAFLTVAALAIGMALGACAKSTAPTPATFAGEWAGRATPQGIVADTAPVSLTIVQADAWHLSGSGHWGSSPFTIINGQQENVAYAGRGVSNVSLRISSPTLGLADLSGALDGATFTGGISWSGKPFNLTLSK